MTCWKHRGYFPLTLKACNPMKQTPELELLPNFSFIPFFLSPSSRPVPVPSSSPLSPSPDVFTEQPDPEASCQSLLFCCSGTLLLLLLRRANTNMSYEPRFYCSRHKTGLSLRRDWANRGYDGLRSQEEHALLMRRRKKTPRLVRCLDKVRGFVRVYRWKTESRR